MTHPILGKGKKDSAYGVADIKELDEQEVPEQKRKVAEHDLSPIKGDTWKRLVIVLKGKCISICGLE